MVEFFLPVRIYFEDTDAGGIVYHGSYIRFFERARTEFLRSIDVTQRLLLEQNIGFVVRHMTVDFLKTARLDQLLTVESRVIQSKKTAIVFEQLIKDETGNLLCCAEVLVVCIDTIKVKPNAIPQSILKEITVMEKQRGSSR